MSTKRKRTIAPPLVASAPSEGVCLVCLLHVADGTITAVRAAVGVSESAAPGQPLAAVFPAAAPRLLLMAERAARTGKTITLALPLHAGTAPLARCTCTPLPSDSASPPHVLLTIEPQPADMPLAHPHVYSSEMNTILEAVADGIVIYDLDGEPLYYNPAALQLLGWTQAGIDPRTLTYQERRAIYRLESMQGVPMEESSTAVEVAHVQQLATQEWRLHRPDGSAVLLSIHPAPIRDPLTDEVIGAVHVLRDVTVWRQNDAIKDEFMSIASHELRAPLQPLLLASRFVQRWIDRPERKAELHDLAEEIVLQAKRMSRLVLDMLDMTRIHAGRFAVQAVPCDLAKIVRNVADEQHTISQRDICVSGSEQPIPILGESERLWQALTNIIQNAIKYSIAPAPVVVAMTTHREDGRAWARVAVTDRGCGIPAEHLPRLFERFYRASVSYQVAPQQQDGLGLGLFIAHAIIDAHGGRLRATSELNVGSTFTIDLPLVEEQAAGD